MSISTISTNQSFQPQMSNVSKASSLTSEQQIFIEELLSGYDSESLSTSDAQEIVQAMQDAGIEPSKGMESAMSVSGFDAKEVGDLAGVGKGGGGGRPMGPPPAASEEEVSSIYDLLETLLAEAAEEAAEAAAEDDTTASTTSSSTISSASFDSVLDYTSKILSLKDDVKTEVMDLLEKYGSDSNTLSQEDTQKMIVNSLSQILKESDNYNTISFYA